MLSTIDIQKFNTLIEINTALNSDYQDVHTLLTGILESAARLCGGEAASLLLLDKADKKLYFEVALGSKGAEVQHFTVSAGQGIAGWVVQHNKSLIINDVEHDPRHFKSISQKINYPSRTMLAVPMRVKDECIGVIELINKKNGALFVQDDLEWLEIFANQAALALLHTKTLEQARNKISFMQDQIDSGYHTMIAKSQAILEKLEIVDRLAKTNSSVLILGESGVGKELFAEQIHLRSNRTNAPFIRVNCAALPENLLESELFGHIKGAFTGAINNRRGRFEIAEGGTIFLDEIGDMPLQLQAKLLRVIQEHTFERLGSDISKTVDVRILTATNKDIEALVARGQFREDLYYRLNVLLLNIPPLRERKEDIIELADFFLKKCMREMKKHFEGFSDSTHAALLAYSWPGNIRELENCIERACVMAKNKWIQPEDLLLKIPAELDKNRDLKQAVHKFKRQYIQKVLEENRGNQTESARVMNIQRTYLSRLIKELETKN
ncbi:MAG: sigma 54-interacting transcriptional regulator [Spirochaetaceae bacterium]|nr:sigma 54-interacting transcriptional regulator [Spirochaetaceae bacterium]